MPNRLTNTLTSWADHWTVSSLLNLAAGGLVGLALLGMTMLARFMYRTL